MASTLNLKSSVAARAPVARGRRMAVTRAAVDPAIAVSGATAAMLAVGRLAFLPYQRRQIAKSDIGPKTTGSTYFDSLQKPASFTVTTNDPAGFTIIDVLGWGALGNATLAGWPRLQALRPVAAQLRHIGATTDTRPQTPEPVPSLPAPRPWVTA